MKISLKKISEEKYEVKISDGENIIFNDQRYFKYMDKEIVNKENTQETINQLTTLFGEFNEIENDFDQ